MPRHPSKRGNPYEKSGEEKHRYEKHWIPAFAGMTRSVVGIFNFPLSIPYFFGGSDFSIPLATHPPYPLRGGGMKNSHHFLEAPALLITKYTKSKNFYKLCSKQQCMPLRRQRFVNKAAYLPIIFNYLALMIWP